MAIETICSGCGQRLAVPEEHAGKQARCPACQTIYTVPYAESSPTSSQFLGSQDSPQPAGSADVGTPATDQSPRYDPFSETQAAPQSNENSGASWSQDGIFPEQALASDEFWMQTADGTQYGPVDRANLNRWFTEGRVGAGYQIRQGQDGPWQPAVAFQPRVNPYADNPLSSSSLSPGPNQNLSQYRKADPSGLVLTMGILAWVCVLICPFVCFIPGLVAWITGRSAIRDIQAGIADPTNLTLVQVGYYLGMINVILSILGFIAFFGIFALSIIV